MISDQPSTRTNSSSLNGSEISEGGNITMPSDISTALTMMSITRNGTKMTKPMMNASRSSLSTNDGTSVRRSTSLRSFGSGRPAGRGPRAGPAGHQRELLVPGLLEHELPQRLAAVAVGLRRGLVARVEGLERDGVDLVERRPHDEQREEEREPDEHLVRRDRRRPQRAAGQGQDDDDLG